MPRLPSLRCSQSSAIAKCTNQNYACTLDPFAWVNTTQEVSRSFPERPLPNLPVTTAHAFSFSQISISPIFKNPRSIFQYRHFRKQHQLSLLPRQFSARSILGPSGCSSSPLSPSRFWPASSMRRPISPLTPRPLISLFEVSFSLLPAFFLAIFLAITTNWFGRSMVPGRVQHLQDSVQLKV